MFTRFTIWPVLLLVLTLLVMMILPMSLPAVAAPTAQRLEPAADAKKRYPTPFPAPARPTPLARGLEFLDTINKGPDYAADASSLMGSGQEMRDWYFNMWAQQLNQRFPACAPFRTCGDVNKMFRCVILIALSVLILSGCDQQGSAKGALASLRGVTSAEGEQAAFGNISGVGEELTIWFYDENGTPLSVGNPELLETVDSIKIRLGKDTVKHEIIDVENLGILLAE